jgi:hypothetical protein
MHRTRPAATAALCRLGPLALTAWLATTMGCVTENTTTGEMVPRGKQSYPWDRVEKLAERLKNGMTKHEALSLMGTPAEVDDADDLWIYLPERYAILIPARALRLEFKDGLLVDHGYRAIVLGTRL